MIKLKEWLADVKLIWVGLLLMQSAAVFALDMRYLTLASYAEGVRQSLQREISLLEIRLGFAKAVDDKQLIRAMIQIKKQQILEVQ